jgi:ketosteroid isomerase-like protein
MKRIFFALLLTTSAFADDVAAIKELLAQARKAHIEKNPDLVVSTFAPDMIMVMNGEVSQVVKEDAIKRFRAYFDAVEFLAWDDIAPPQITISPDGKLAHVVIEKNVHLIVKKDGSKERTRFAWSELWQKTEGEWKLKVVASTRKDLPKEPAKP